MERKNSKPWILPWLEDACARKNKLYHNFVKNPSSENKTKYDKLKKFCKIHIEKSKTRYKNILRNIRVILRSNGK